MKVATLKNPPKKKVIWPWVLIGSVVLTITLPVVLLYAFVYDGNTKKVTLQEDLNLKTIGNNIIVDSLDNTVSKEQIAITITENDIDNILHIALEKAVKNNPVIKKAYIKIKGTTYTFYVDVDATVFKTRVILSTTMKESEDKNAFIFSIKDVALGRVSGISGPMKALVNKFVNEQTINSFIQSANLSMTFDQPNFQLIYTKEGMMNDLNRLTNDEQLGLYFDVIQTMVKDNLVDFELETNNFAEGYIDLTKLRTNDRVTDDAEHIKVQPEEVTTNCKNKLVDLIEHGDVDPEKDDLALVFSYLFGGWKYLTTEEQTKIQAIDFSYVDINDVTTYYGFDLVHNEDKIVDSMKGTIDGAKLTNKSLDPRYKKLCDLSENTINKYIAGRNIVGYTSLLHRKTKDGYKVNYVTIDNFYCNLYRKAVEADYVNVAEFVCKMNINGYHTSLTFDSEMGPDAFQDKKVVFTVKDVQFGITNAENLKEHFFNIIFDALSGAGSDDSMSADKVNKTISVNFGEVLQAAEDTVEDTIGHARGSLASQFTMDNMEFTIQGSSRTDEGIMRLSLKEPLDY